MAHNSPRRYRGDRCETEVGKKSVISVCEILTCRQTKAEILDPLAGFLARQRERCYARMRVTLPETRDPFNISHGGQGAGDRGISQLPVIPYANVRRSCFLLFLRNPAKALQSISLNMDNETTRGRITWSAFGSFPETRAIDDRERENVRPREDSRARKRAVDDHVNHHRERLGNAD